MGFNVKDWKDYPDTSTPITAASLEDVETRVSGYAVAPDVPWKSTSSFTDTGSAYLPQLDVNPSVSTATAGRAELHLHGKDGNDAYLQRKHAMIRFWTSTDYEADATLKAHIHDAAGSGGFQHHIQFHTKNASGELTDRFLISIGDNNATIQVSAAHLQFATDAYITGHDGTATGEVPIHGRPLVTSQASGTASIFYIGRTAGEVLFGTASGSGSLMTDTAAGDCVVRVLDDTKQLFLGVGTAGAIRMSSQSSGATPKLAFYGTAPITQPNITGSKGGNAALGDLITKLASLGLISDSTT